MEYFTLHNGLKIPALGYGVYQIQGDQCAECVTMALDSGYRLIDTAQEYRNEEFVGKGISSSHVPREEIFLTTKIWVDKYENARESVYESLEKLDTGYIDLILLHQPFGNYYKAYRDLEALYAEGVVKAIGVSNFYPDRLIDIASFTDVKPMVNQIEINPYHQRKSSEKWNNIYDVRLEAWAPFGENRNGLFEDPVLAKIADAHGKSTAQVILRWLIQRGIIALQKTVRRRRMEENIDVFDFALTEAEMADIAALDAQKSAFFSHSDPDTVQFFMDYIK